MATEFEKASGKITRRIYSSQLWVINPYFNGGLIPAVQQLHHPLPPPIIPQNIRSEFTETKDGVGAELSPRRKPTCVTLATDTNRFLLDKKLIEELSRLALTPRSW